MLYVNLLLINLNTVPIYELKNKYPSNIYLNSQNLMVTTAPNLKAVNETLQEALHRLADEKEDAAHLAAGARGA